MLSFTVPPESSGIRLDRFCEKCRPDLSRVSILKGIRTKKIKLNGKRTEGSARVAPDDVVTIYLADKAPKTAISSGGFTVVYEDERILIVDKPAGLLSHDPTGKISDTLEARVNLSREKSGGAVSSVTASIEIPPASCSSPKTRKRLRLSRRLFKITKSKSIIYAYASDQSAQNRGRSRISFGKMPSAAASIFRMYRKKAQRRQF